MCHCRMVSTRRQSRIVISRSGGKNLDDEADIPTASTSAAVSPANRVERQSLPLTPSPVVNEVVVDTESKPHSSAKTKLRTAPISQLIDDTTVWPADAVRESLFPRLETLWAPGNNYLSAAEGRLAIVLYSRLCCLDATLCSDSLTEAYLSFLSLTGGADPDVIAAMKRHLAQRRFSDIGMARLVSLGFAWISESAAAIELLVGVLTEYNSEYSEMVFEKLSLSIPSLSARVLVDFLVATVQAIVYRQSEGLREAHRFVARIHNRLVACPEIVYSDLMKELLRFHLDAKSAVQKLFIFQALSLHIVKAVLAGHLLAIAGTLGEGIAKVTARSDTDDTALLPCPLYPVGDGRPDVQTCGDEHCPGATVTTRGRATNLEKFGLFKCFFCENIFSSDCNQCGTCPVRVGAAASRSCWGCGYRLIASGELGDSVVGESVDEITTAFGLVLAAISGTSEDPVWDSLSSAEPAKLFCLETLVNSHPELQGQFAPVRQSLITNVQEDTAAALPQFLPSNEFVSSVIHKLFIRDKLKRLSTDLLSKALMAIPPSAASLRALANFPPAREDFCLAVLATMDVTNVRLVNAAVSLVEALPGCHEGVLSLLLSHKLSITTKKLIFKVLAGGGRRDFDDSLIGYVLLDEVVPQDATALFDQLVDAMVAQWTAEPDRSLRGMASLAVEMERNWTFRDRFSAKIPQSLVLRLVHDESVPLKLKLAAVDVLTARSEDPDDMWSLLVHPLTELLTAATDSETRASCIRAMTHCFPPHPTDIVYSHLIPFLVTENSAVVRASCHLISRCNSSTVPELLGRFRLNNPENDDQATLRAAWVLASFAEVGGLHSVATATEVAEYVFADLDNLESRIPLIGFLARNSAVREGLIARPEFAEMINRTLSSESLAVRGLEVLVGVMESVSPQSPDVPSETSRPSAGVSCRPFSQFFSPVCQFVNASSNSFSIRLALRTLELMDQLGIVNRRSLPPVFLARHVLSLQQNGHLDFGDAEQVNMYAFKLFVATSDNNMHHCIPNLLVELRNRLEPNASGAVNAVIRFVEFAFPPSNLFVRKDDSKLILKLLFDQLKSVADLACGDGFAFFVAASLAIGLKRLPEERPGIVKQISHEFALADDHGNGFVYKHVTFELGHTAGDQKHMFDRVVEMFTRFRTRTMPMQFSSIELHPPPVRKRGRAAARPETKPTKKRKTVAELAEGSSDDEYTNGLSSDPDDEI